MPIAQYVVGGEWQACVCQQVIQKGWIDVGTIHPAEDHRKISYQAPAVPDRRTTRAFTQIIIGPAVITLT